MSIRDEVERQRELDLAAMDDRQMMIARGLQILIIGEVRARTEESIPPIYIRQARSLATNHEARHRLIALLQSLED